MSPVGCRIWPLTCWPAGRAGAEVCADDCNSDTVTPVQVLGECDRAVGAGAPEIAAAWLVNDEVGVDFCIPNLTTAQTFTTTLTDGEQPSNGVTTTCSLSGGFLDCVSE